MPGGHEAVQALGNVGHALELVENAGVPARLESGAPDPGLLLRNGEAQSALPEFIQAIAKHRHFEREMDPPAV